MSIFLLTSWMFNSQEFPKLSLHTPVRFTWLNSPGFSLSLLYVEVCETYVHNVARLRAIMAFFRLPCLHSFDVWVWDNVFLNCQIAVLGTSCSSARAGVRGLIYSGTVRRASCMLTAPIFTIIKGKQTLWLQPHCYHSSQFNPQSGCHHEAKPIAWAPHWAGPPKRIWPMKALVNHTRYYHLAYPWRDEIAKYKLKMKFVNSFYGGENQIKQSPLCLLMSQIELNRRTMTSWTSGV